MASLPTIVDDILMWEDSMRLDMGSVDGVWYQSDSLHVFVSMVGQPVRFCRANSAAHARSIVTTISDAIQDRRRS